MLHVGTLGLTISLLQSVSIWDSDTPSFPIKQKRRERMNRKRLVFPFFLAAILVTVACATVYFEKTIPNIGKVKADYEIEVLWQGNASEVVEIQWGELLTAEEKTMEDITLRNVGNVPIYMAWHTENLPSYLTLSAQKDYDGWEDWQPNTWIGPFQPPPDTIYVLVRFTLTVSETATPGDTFNFNIIFEASDTG